jgi:nucleoside-diphosphate-sugar epimerase
MKNYLVTGSTGFIGVRLLGFLKTMECNVRLLSKTQVANYETFECTLGQDRIPNGALKSIDTVFHLAGLAHDVQNPQKVKNLYYLINVEATLELARLAIDSGVKRFVFISSVKAGGIPVSGIYGTENNQSSPDGIYGESKREAELRLLELAKDTDMHLSIIRPTLVYGPGVKGNLKLMLSAIESGWFPPLPETKSKRSMVHVDDLVGAIFLAANNSRANGEIFIVTDGLEYSSRKIYNIMREILGKPRVKWSIPKALFDFISLINSRLKHKVDKLFGGEFYSSKKLELLGFKAKKTLRDMNETNF